MFFNSGKNGNIQEFDSPSKLQPPTNNKVRHITSNIKTTEDSINT